MSLNVLFYNQTQFKDETQNFYKKKSKEQELSLKTSSYSFNLFVSGKAMISLKLKADALF